MFIESSGILPSYIWSKYTFLKRRSFKNNFFPLCVLSINMSCWKMNKYKHIEITSWRAGSTVNTEYGGWRRQVSTGPKSMRNMEMNTGSHSVGEGTSSLTFCLWQLWPSYDTKSLWMVTTCVGVKMLCKSCAQHRHGFSSYYSTTRLPQSATKKESSIRTFCLTYLVYNE